MGCCLSQPETDDEIPNLSKLTITQSQPQALPQSQMNIPSASQSLHHKNEGKKYFTSGNFAQAVTEYKQALKYDSGSVVNYTNLALAQKCLHCYEDSILTVRFMEDRFGADHGDIGIIVKGKIIKARCLSILVKNYCLGEKSASAPLTSEKALTLITESSDTLTALLENPHSQSSARSLNAAHYLENTKKIKSILLSLKNRTHPQNQEQIFQYFQKRLKSKESLMYFQTSGIGKYVGKPQDVLRELQEFQKARKREFLKDQGDEEEEFIIDPITYDQFKNPILVKSGHTYEEQVLKSHYEKNGSFDPITRQKFDDELGVRNNTLMAYILQTRRVNSVNQLKYLNL